MYNPQSSTEIQSGSKIVGETAPLYTLKKLQSDFHTRKITSGDEASKFIKQFYGDDLEVFESFFLLLLDRSNKTLGYAKISQGGVAATVVDTKLVAKYAVESLASAVILAHNHPSGALQPSEQDKTITKQIDKALNLFGIQVMDHIILTADSFYSFANNGLI